MNANNKSGRLILLSCCILIVVATLSGCTTTKELAKKYIENAMDIDAEKTVTVPKDHFYVLSMSITSQKDVSIELEVEEGGNIDFLLMDKEGYDDYKDSMSTSYGYYPDGSKLNIKKTELSCTLPSNPYFIIDNTNRPSGGADPTGSETEYLKVSS